ncbi:hypothetical protein HJ024_00715 [Vibrio parahaemolyticus]|nr:hypothetical protein [Vibrio parahaemolyticus]
MTIETELDRVLLDCDGVQTKFTFPFKIFSPNDLKVFLIDGVKTTELINIVDYEVLGFDWMDGGDIEVKTVYDNTKKIFMLREPDLLQETSFRNLGNFYPEVHEDAFDRIYMILQGHRWDLEHALLADQYDVWDFQSRQSKNVPSPEAGDSVANAAFVLNEIGKAQHESIYISPIYWDGKIEAGVYFYPLNGADVADENAYRVVINNEPKRPKKRLCDSY